MEQSDRYRFYVERLDNTPVGLSQAEAHHARGVLRLSEGQEVELFDGLGGLARGTLRLPGKRDALVEIRQRESLSRPQPIITLAFAVPKGKRLDWLLEKATERGASRLQPVEFARSVAAPELSAHARQRWQAECIAAAKQSGNNFLPEILPPAALVKVLEGFSSARAAAGAGQGGLGILGQAGAERSLAQVLADWPGGGELLLVVGPEGGLTGQERADCLEAGLVPACVGANTLRIETAAIALLAGAGACRRR
jgi:16S rRNA (uracil1498-N3)-methyltransferase